MKVLVVSSKYPPEYAGSGLRAHKTYKRLAHREPGLRFEVICSSQEFGGSDDYVYEGVKVQRVSSRLFHALSRFSDGKAGRILRALRVYAEAIPAFLRLWRVPCDIIHVFGISPATTAAIFWSRWRDIPLILELVNAGASPAQSFPGLRALFRPRLEQRAVVVAISSALREPCRRMGLEGNIWVRPNPVDEQVFHPDCPARQRLRRRFTPFGEGDCVLVTVAKFMPRKNQLFLIDVLACLPERFKLVLAGPLVSSGAYRARDADYLDQIRARIAALGLEERVLVEPGFVDAADYMKLADVYLAPHVSEGLGTPILESLACGVPVVANKGEPAFMEWIRDGQNGFTCPLDAGAWADAIKEAARFSGKKMLAVSKEILAAASSQAIDTKYLSLLRTLIALPRAGTVNIDYVFSRT